MSNPRQTPQVVLAPLQPDHLDHVMTWVNDPMVMGYFTNRQEPITASDELTYIHHLQTSKTDMAWSVFDAETHAYVGQCSINAIYWPAKNGRCFLAVTRAQQGKGYGKAILSALLEMGFKTLNLHKLWLIVREENTDAIAKYIQAGFKFEGLLKDEYCVNGKFYDMVRMGKINPAG